ncbi:Hsp20/alpha crystallin family protein [Methylocella sp.]|uniref:Hsp20/alpha crystallin family protein n=1 Tax=Methylocella sp. TaxID=1978226 RepID=UPI00378418B4
MKDDDARTWMWSDAVEVLSRADRLHRQLFQLAATHARRPSWEPPVDLFETEREVLALAALPGVDPKDIALRVENGSLVISGERVLPPQARAAAVHRLELPQGRFERVLPLPSGRYEVMAPAMLNGCLVISLRKI